jgi:hypothetical protein
MDPRAGGGVLGSDVAGAEPPEGVAVQLDRGGGTLGVAAAQDPSVVLLVVTQRIGAAPATVTWTCVPGSAPVSRRV